MNTISSRRALLFAIAGAAFAFAPNSSSDSVYTPDPIVQDQVVAPGTFEPMWLDDLQLATSIAAEREQPLMVVFR
jgi:hypothetical protein